MKGVSELKEALQAKSVTALTKALSELAAELAYELKPPYTEILEFKAKEENDMFAVHFQAELDLHYSNLASQQEGLVFVIQFGGDAFSDSPTPPIHELFYAGVVESFSIYGYGSRWKGTAITADQKFMRNLEVSSKTLNDIDGDRFFQLLPER